MKKTKKLFSGLLATALAAVMCFSVAGCGERNPDNDDDQNNNDPKPQPTVGISIAGGAPNEIRAGETVTLTVTVTNAADTSYTWSVVDEAGNESGVLAVSAENVVTVEEDVTLDTVATVVATANADTTKTATHTFTVKPAIQGQVGELTAALLEEVAGPNITVSGTVTDVYQDLNYAPNSYQTAYNSTVMMDQDKWYGSFYAEEDGYTQNVISDNYRAGEQIQGGNGRQLLRVVVNRNNVVEPQVQTDYMSTPLPWEAQHLWNHLGNLGTDISEKFEYDVTNDEYVYQIEHMGEYDTDYTDDEYLMTYLSVSLTPMLNETFDQFRLKITDGHITNIWAQTLVQTTYADDGETATSNFYTEVDLTISDVGTTKVPEPTPYEVPEYVEYLQAAIDQMKTARNYTFSCIDNQVTAPEFDDSDYEMESLSASISAPDKAAPLASGALYYTKHNAPTGTLGMKGFVTEEAAIFESTGQYSYTSDNNKYYVGYTGYKQEDGYFEYLDDEQVYVDNVAGLIGVQRRNGNYFDVVMPKFDFSPNIFEWSGAVRSQLVGGKRYQIYDFYLRDTSITAEVARQISAHSNAKDGQAAAYSTLKISVLVENDTAEFKSIYSTEFPYVGSYGTGWIETTYSNFGTTELYANAFDEAYYIPRVWRSEWSQYTIHDYDPTYSNNGADADAVTVFQHMFGSNAIANLPKPEIFMNLICDGLNGPWFDYSEQGGKTVEEVSFNLAFNNDDPHLDNKGRPINIEGFLGAQGELTKALEAVGFTYSPSNSGLRNPSLATSSYFATYIKPAADIMIVVESNCTKNLFFTVYHNGDWHLTKG